MILFIILFTSDEKTKEIQEKKSGLIFLIFILTFDMEVENEVKISSEKVDDDISEISALAENSNRSQQVNFDRLVNTFHDRFMTNYFTELFLKKN